MSQVGGISGPRRKYQDIPDDESFGALNGNGVNGQAYGIADVDVPPQKYDHNDIDFHIENMNGGIHRSTLQLITASCIAIFLFLLSVFITMDHNVYDADHVIRSPAIDISRYCTEEAFTSTEGQQTCRTSCEPGLCCFEDKPNNCYRENKLICSKYSPCQILFSDSEDYANNDSEKKKKKEDTHKQEKDKVQKVRPAPSNIQDICSIANTETITGILECETVCEGGSCCWEGICDTRYPEECSNYEICKRISSSLSSVEKVKYACARTKIGSSTSLTQTERLQNRKKCEDLCEPRECCFSTGLNNCYADNKIWCDEYIPCEGLQDSGNSAPLSNSPTTLDIPQDCKQESLVKSGEYGKCEEVCSLASCCFSGEECLKKGMDCEKFSVCKSFYNPEKIDDDVSNEDSENDDEIVVMENDDDESGAMENDDNNNYIKVEDYDDQPFENEFVETEDGSTDKNDNNHKILEVFDDSEVGSEEQTDYPTPTIQDMKGFLPGKEDEKEIEENSPEAEVLHMHNTVSLLEPPDGLEVICDPESMDISLMKKTCDEACAPALCCVGVGDIDCSISHRKMCYKFIPCNSLWELEGYHPTIFDNDKLLNNFVDTVESKTPSFEEALKKEEEKTFPAIDDYSSEDKTIEYENFTPSPTISIVEISNAVPTDLKQSGSMLENEIVLKSISWICSKNKITEKKGYDRCVLECNPALCCIGIGDDCSTSKHDWCESYKPCNVVWESEQGTTLDDDITASSKELKNVNLNNVESEEVENQSTPTTTSSSSSEAAYVSISQICSDENIGTKEGHNQCVLECNTALCCVGVGTDCSISRKDWCDDFEFCSNVWEGEHKDDTKHKSIPPTFSPTEPEVVTSAEPSISFVSLPSGTTSRNKIYWLCDEENIQTKGGYDRCVLECQPALCCLGVGKDCSSSKSKWCDDFEFCNNVWKSDFNDPNENKARPPTFSPTTSQPTRQPSAKEEDLKSKIDHLCSEPSISTQIGYDRCVVECHPSLCCIGVGHDCHDSRRDWCKSFEACSDLWNEEGDNKKRNKDTNKEKVNKGTMKKPNVYDDSEALESDDFTVDANDDYIDDYLDNEEEVRKEDDEYVDDAMEDENESSESFILEENLISPKSISSICSDENISHKDGFSHCVLECNSALCCIGVGKNCKESRSKWCKEFESCSKVWEN